MPRIPSLEVDSESRSGSTRSPVPPLVRPELLAPAGTMDCVRAAVANGADAVYFGLDAFNARMRAENFTLESLPGVVEFVHAHGVRAHVALNTLVFTSELEEAARMLEALERAGVDVVILQDLGVARLARALAPSVSLHASTQMTVTSPEGARLVARLGLEQVVLARELSLGEIEAFDAAALPLEVFVHGALCVAYSGQCLTSESLGQRSANRGECAQACRQPYDLIVDGARRDLGDRRFLLSPQDLAAVREVPELIRLGVRTLKIEGRLKSPEYVAAVTDVYRRAIDAAFDAAREGRAAPPELADGDRYRLEMTFSRGLFTGWLRGDDHQQLVHGRFGKKRGPLVGRVRRVGRDHVELDAPPPAFLRPGDGLVFDTGGDTESEQGGRLFELRGARLLFENGKIDFGRLRAGDLVWKTDDPRLRRALRGTFENAPPPRRSIDVTASGRAGEPLVLEARLGGVRVRAESRVALQEARSRPLDRDVLEAQLGRLGGTPFRLGTLDLALEGAVMAPLSELNRVRRELVARLEQALSEAASAELSREAHASADVPSFVARAVAEATAAARAGAVVAAPRLVALCRSMPQLEAALESGVRTVYADFEDLRRYGDAVLAVRGVRGAEVFLATPRVQKPGEIGFFHAIERCMPDGILARNLGAVEHFRGRGIRMVGDATLNVANPLAAAVLIREGLERLTASYDLDGQQLVDLLRLTPCEWLEITLHQHMPMFHMAHCVFAAFLSDGKDHTDCGHPCDRHRIEVRDHVGMSHPVTADVGCRNTIFNATAQSGAVFFERFARAGARTFRVELLDEDAGVARRTIGCYTRLLDGSLAACDLIAELRATSQLGVTIGTLRVS